MNPPRPVMPTWLLKQHSFSNSWFTLCGPRVMSPPHQKLSPLLSSISVNEGRLMLPGSFPENWSMWPWVVWHIRRPNCPFLDSLWDWSKATVCRLQDPLMRPIDDKFLKGLAKTVAERLSNPSSSIPHPWPIGATTCALSTCILMKFAWACVKRADLSSRHYVRLRIQ